MVTFPIYKCENRDVKKRAQGHRSSKDKPRQWAPEPLGLTMEHTGKLFKLLEPQFPYLLSGSGWGYSNSSPVGT